MSKILFWFKQVAVAVDQLGNAVLGGWADETLSSRAYRMERAGRPWGRILRPAIDALFFLQTAHCKSAFEHEKLRLQAHPESR